MNWETYEETVKNIYEVLGARNGVKIECYGNSCKCTGKSGLKHQIDVLTVHTDGIHNYKTSIECKYSAQKINKDIVMKVLDIRQDCNFQKGIIVSKMGFTPDAIQLAKYYDIGLVELREPLKQDIENRITEVNINIIPLIPNITRLDNIVHEEEDQNHTHFEINTSDTYYLFPDGTHKTIRHLVDDFFREIKQAQKINELTEKIVLFPNDTYLQSPSPELSLRVKSVHIQGILVTDSMPETVKIMWKDRVWLIMKSIFEEKMFTVSRSGNIQEV